MPARINHDRGSSVTTCPTTRQKQIKILGGEDGLSTWTVQIRAGNTNEHKSHGARPERPAQGREGVRHGLRGSSRTLENAAFQYGRLPSQRPLLSAPD